MSGAVRLACGNVDLWSMAAPGGVSIGLNVVDDKNSGRNENTADMYRRIVGKKEKIVVKFRNLSQKECQQVMALARTAFIHITYLSPSMGQRQNVLFYAQINSPTLTLPMTIKGSFQPWTWAGLELTLVEK